MGKKAKIDYDAQANTVKGTIEPTADERINDKIRAVVGTFGGDNTEQEFVALIHRVDEARLRALLTAVTENKNTDPRVQAYSTLFDEYQALNDQMARIQHAKEQFEKATRYCEFGTCCT